MSQPSLANPMVGTPSPAPKQETNVYTVMLIVSFLCIVTACLLLYFELRRWGSFPWWNTAAATPNTQAYYAPPDNPPASDLLC